LIKRLTSLYDRASAQQERPQARIFLSVVSVVLVGAGAIVSVNTDAAWLPAAYRQNVFSGSVIALAVSLGLIWLGLSVQALLIAFIALPLTWAFTIANSHVLAQITLGVGTLTLVFLAVLASAKLLLNGSRPVLAIARNVLDEAIRMRIAMVFVGALILLLPVLLTQLKASEPLRYRIQTFLSYGTGMSYALLAMMTLFVATATVAFEQRDKQIYQIVAKPVSRLEYLLGKWLGVMTLNLILLAMIGGAVFWFTQFLRVQPAMDQYDALAASEQVLTARVGVYPTLNDAEISTQAIAAAKAEIAASAELDDSLETLNRLATENIARFRSAEMTIAPGEYKEYLFENVRPRGLTKSAITRLGEVIFLDEPIKSFYDIKVHSTDGSRIYSLGTNYQLNETFDAIRPMPAEEQKISPQPMIEGESIVIEYFPENAMTLSFKLNAGDNDPGIHFPLTFVLPDLGNFADVQEVALVQTQTMLVPAGAVREDGSLRLHVINGDARERVAGPMAISFPPDGLQIMYKVDSFEWNYFRAMAVTWLKLGFLAMLGITAATFASFPVACIIALSIFLGAESAPYLAESLQYYKTTDITTNEVIYGKAVVSGLGYAVHWLFNAYGEIRPSQNLIEGRMITWSVVGKTLWMISGVWTGLTLLVGWAVFRSRQLAIYSGHQ